MGEYACKARLMRMGRSICRSAETTCKWLQARLPEVGHRMKKGNFLMLVGSNNGEICGVVLYCTTSGEG